MKIFIAVATIFASLSSYACQCSGPNFTKTNVHQAVMYFMESKVNIPEASILSSTLKYESSFASKSVRAVLAATSIGEDETMKSCDLDCAKAMNEIYLASVSYTANGQTCSQELKVVMKSNSFTSSFTSKVIKSVYPDCK